MKRFLIGFFITMSLSVAGQVGISAKKFDNLYNQAFKLLSVNRDSAVQCLKRLQEQNRDLSNIQRAKVNYLVLRVFFSGMRQTTELENALLVVPDSLTGIDSIRCQAGKYLERSMPDRAIPVLLRALTQLPSGSEIKDDLNIELCEAYRQKQEYEKGIDLLYGMLENSSELSDRNRAFAWNRLAALYNESEKPKKSYTDSVFKYSMLCYDLAEKTGDKANLAASQNEMSYQYRRTREYDKALELSKQSVANFEAAGQPFHAMNALINQSNIYNSKEEYAAALQSLEKATLLAPVWQNRNLYMRIYRQFAGVYAAMGNYPDAYEFMLLCNQLQGEFFKDRINGHIHEQSAKYDLFVKEQKIRDEKKKNEFNQRQILFLVMISIALMLAFIFSFYYFRMRRKGVEKQKLIEAVVETETSERRRIARDLHDGLGPVLSAINHYFQAFLDATPDNKASIQGRLQTVITEAIDEVSRISHNISPHVLEKHGLMTALNNLLAPLMSNGKYEVLFTSGITQQFDPKIELTVYRCITELLNNTMKHAAATRITLDLRHSEGNFLIFYSDNGKGFDPGAKRIGGMGLTNITNRVESFGGSFALETSMYTGIIVNIKIPVGL